MKDQIKFDTTDANTRGDGDKIGAVLYDAVNDRLGLINASQELLVKDTDAAGLLTTIDADTASMDATLTALSKAEDAVHGSGDQGIMGLAVRNDTLAALADTDGDYAPLQVNASGALYVDVASGINVEVDLSHVDDSVRLGDGSSFFTSTSESGDIALDVHISNASIPIDDTALADTAIAAAAKTLTIAGTSEVIVASALANRKYVWVYNNDNRQMYLGPSGVTSATGFPISPGAYLEMRAGPNSVVHFDGKTGHAIRTMEAS